MPGGRTRGRSYAGNAPPASWDESGVPKAVCRGDAHRARDAGRGMLEATAAAANPDVPPPLGGTVAVVTGASSGLGRAIAVALAARGAALHLVGRSAERLGTVADVARAMGAEARSYPADLASDERIEELCAVLCSHLEQVDILVHSAGVIALGRLEEASPAALDRQYRINVRAPYILTQRLLPLIKRCQGQIVFINSSAGLSARGNVGQYAATKHALRAVADSLRDEVNGDGVRILSVFLGRMASPMQEGVHRTEGRAYRPDRLVQPEDAAAVVLSALTLPRTAEVTDVTIRPLAKPQ